jgi:hypothetical protein
VHDPAGDQRAQAITTRKGPLGYQSVPCVAIWDLALARVVANCPAHELWREAEYGFSLSTFSSIIARLLRHLANRKNGPMLWNQYKDGRGVINSFREIAKRIREGELDLGRKQYALTLSVGVASAIFCNVGKVVAVEFGVGGGAGLLDLCKAAQFFREEFGTEIEVYGLDNATGLPEATDYRDHPELWHKGQFLLRDPDQLRAKLPPYAKLVVGDVADTTALFKEVLGRDSPLGFVSVDVDYYSSTVPCLEILRQDVSCYLPIVPMYFDDLMKHHVTYNSWSGESLAIKEFNRDNSLRKIEANEFFNTTVKVRPYHACHILDHPLRTGFEKPRSGFGLLDLHFY